MCLTAATHVRQAAPENVTGDGVQSAGCRNRHPREGATREQRRASGTARVLAAVDSRRPIGSVVRWDLPLAHWQRTPPCPEGSRPITPRRAPGDSALQRLYANKTLSLWTPYAICLTPGMSCRQMRRALCFSLCKGRVAFDCQLDPFVRRHRVPLPLRK